MIFVIRRYSKTFKIYYKNMINTTDHADVTDRADATDRADVIFFICPIEVKAENIKENTDSDLVNTTDRADATDIADFTFYLSDWK